MVNQLSELKLIEIHGGSISIAWIYNALNDRFLEKFKSRNMGKVRPKFVKRLARQLLERYPEKFSLDFQQNKIAVQELIIAPSKRTRNLVAGYLTRLVKIKARQSQIQHGIQA